MLHQLSEGVSSHRCKLQPTAFDGTMGAHLTGVVWALGRVGAAVPLAHAVAVPHAHLVAVVKHLLLCWLQLGIKGFGGITTGVHRCAALGAQCAHAVYALGGGELRHVLTIPPGLRGCGGLHGLLKVLPRRFLGRAEGELLVQLRKVLGAAFCTLLLPLLALGSVVTGVVTTLRLRAGAGFCRCGGRGGLSQSWETEGRTSQRGGSTTVQCESGKSGGGGGCKSICTHGISLKEAIYTARVPRCLVVLAACVSYWCAQFAGA